MWKHPTEHLGEDKAKKKRSDFLAVVYSYWWFMSRTGKNQNVKMRDHLMSLGWKHSIRTSSCFCALHSNFCLKESLGKGEVIRMLREKKSRKTGQKRTTYSTFCISKFQNGSREGKSASRNLILSANLLTFHSVSWTVLLVFNVPHFSPTRNPLVILYSAFLKALQNSTLVLLQVS